MTLSAPESVLVRTHVYTTTLCNVSCQVFHLQSKKYNENDNGEIQCNNLIFLRINVLLNTILNATENLFQTSLKFKLQLVWKLWKKIRSSFFTTLGLQVYVSLIHFVLTLKAPTRQNGQAHSKNSSAVADELFKCVWPFFGVG